MFLNEKLQRRDSLLQVVSDFSHNFFLKTGHASKETGNSSMHHLALGMMELKKQSSAPTKAQLKSTVFQNDFSSSDKFNFNTLEDSSSNLKRKKNSSHSSETSCESLATYENTDSDSFTENSLHNLALNQSDIFLNMTLDSKSKGSPNSIYSCSKDSIFDSSLDSSYLNKTFENGDILNPRSPFLVDANLSRTQKICHEMLITEKTYVNDLREVIEGYIYHLKQQTDLNIEELFGNLEEIYEFNKEVLSLMEECEIEDNEIDVVQLANIFCEKAEGFNHHYTSYCTNFPEISSLFTVIMHDPRISAFFTMRQHVIGHALSLESYLLKPVQRILKYHLLFRDILKSYDGDVDSYNIINSASQKMSDVAEYINEMKRLHENAQKVQEILNKIVDLNDAMNVFSTGRFVLENSFKVHGIRGDRYFYLFEKMLLVCKKSDDMYHFKEKIECSDMILQEGMKDSLIFQVMRYSNSKVSYSIVAKNLEIKKIWIQHLKRLIVESHKALIPQTVRQAILGPEEKSRSKYNSLSIDALDDPIFSNKISAKNKENHGVVTYKKEQNDKDLLSPKRNLNTKAKEFLLDKRNRVSMRPSSPNIIHEKEKKEKNRWMLFNKPKRSADHSNQEPYNAMQHHTQYNNVLGVNINRTETLTKSRSLESLKDSIKDSQNELKVVHEDNITGDHDYAEIKDIIRMIRQPALANLDSVENSFCVNEAESSLNNSAQQEQILEELQPGFSNEICDQQDEFTQIRHRASTTDKLSRLEKRLSILNDDDNSSTSIKAMVRKVSNAFGNPVQPFETSLKGSVISPGNVSNVSRDLSILLGNSLDKTRYRYSVGSLQNSFFRAPLERSRSLTSFKEITGKKESSSENQLLSVSKISLSSNEDQSCSEDVDDVVDVDDVLESIKHELGSIVKNNDKVSMRPTSRQQAAVRPLSAFETTLELSKKEPLFISSSCTAIDINARAAAVDERLKKANPETASLDTVRELNVEVKRVADRIREYKKLIDAEKKVRPLKVNEPLSEMIESLDSIKQSPIASSTTYSYHRKRFSRPPSILNQNDVFELEAESLEQSSQTNDLLSQIENKPDHVLEKIYTHKPSSIVTLKNEETGIPPLQEKNKYDDKTIEEKRVFFSEKRKAKSFNETLNSDEYIQNSKIMSVNATSIHKDMPNQRILIRTPSLPQMDKNSYKLKTSNIRVKSRRNSASSLSINNENDDNHIRGRVQIRHLPNNSSENEVSPKVNRLFVKRKSFYRSASLPRRSYKVEFNDTKEKTDVIQDVTWSPSAYCNQQNLVNDRIKQYFTNLQTASKISTSRPRLLLVGSYDSDSDTSSDGHIPFKTSNSLCDNEVVQNDNPDHIMKGTVRSMIKKYAANYVFDK
ncbi:uncharacterized protein LOC100207358 isoform X2 [Hydra vulgaris]|uniref:uncharacterized protein LOC100207358 isoform X2 n=1 Tax=Hydra vulgaris TaxID=6087 RepID=UPI001F5F7640|nr:uncharacterized protein LOC100207358 isoform X2 [Hydra vulgaris]